MLSHLGLAFVLMLRPYSPEFVMFPYFAFWTTLGTSICFAISFDIVFSGLRRVWSITRTVVFRHPNTWLYILLFGLHVKPLLVGISFPLYSSSFSGQWVLNILRCLDLPDKGICCEYVVHFIKTEVPMNVWDSKVWKQDKFRRNWYQH